MSARRKKSVSFSTDVSPDAKTTKVASFHIPASDEKPTQANDAHAQDAKPDVGTVQAVVAFGLVKVGFRYEAELPAPTFAGWRVKGVKLLESGVGDVSVETDTASAKCSVVLDASVDGKVDVDIPVQLGLEHVSTDSHPAQLETAHFRLPLHRANDASLVSLTTGRELCAEGAVLVHTPAPTAPPDVSIAVLGSLRPLWVTSGACSAPTVQWLLQLLPPNAVDAKRTSTAWVSQNVWHARPAESPRRQTPSEMSRA